MEKMCIHCQRYVMEYTTYNVFAIQFKKWLESRKVTNFARCVSSTLLLIIINYFTPESISKLISIIVNYYYYNSKNDFEQFSPNFLCYTYT